MDFHLTYSSDIKRCISHSGISKESLQKMAWKERKKEREERRKSTAEEELRRIEDREKILERERQLEEERKVDFLKILNISNTEPS